MDHLKEIRDALGRANGWNNVAGGTIVYLKPDPTVALLEAQQQARYLVEELHRQRGENQRLQLQRRADYEEFQDRQHRFEKVAQDAIDYARKGAEEARKDSELLRNGNIIEISVANKSGSVGEYMKHWESRALAAEEALKQAKIQNDSLSQMVRDQERRITQLQEQIVFERNQPFHTVVYKVMPPGMDKRRLNITRIERGRNEQHIYVE